MPVFSKKIWAKPSQFFSLRASWRQQQGLARPGTNLSKKLYFQYILEKSAKNVENVEAESKNILTDIRYGQFCEFFDVLPSMGQNRQNWVRPYISHFLIFAKFHSDVAWNMRKQLSIDSACEILVWIFSFDVYFLTGFRRKMVFTAIRASMSMDYGASKPNQKICKVDGPLGHLLS